MTEQNKAPVIQIIGQNEDVVNAYGNMLAIKHRGITLDELKGSFSGPEGEFYSKEDIIKALDNSLGECAEALKTLGEFDVQIGVYEAEEGEADDEQETTASD